MRYSLSKKKRTKKEYALSLLAVVIMMSLTGCSLKLPENIFTDSGTNVVQQVDTSQYLDLSKLDEEKNGEEKTWNGYEICTLTYGTFATDITGIQANINMVETSPVRAEFSNGTMYLLELLVTRNSYVEKGEVLARVTMETSSLDLEELQLKILRLEEEYTKYLADFTERYEDAKANISVYELLAAVDKLKIERMELDHAQTVGSYEKQLESYKERIKELEKTSALKEIVAPKAGFVLSVSRLEAGQELRNGDVICNLAPEDKLMLEFTDETWHYGYGMDLQLLVGDKRLAKPQNVEAVSAIGKVLYGDWNQTTTKIVGDYNMSDLIKLRPYTVTGTTNVMENVILVPKDAVTEDGEKCFVTVLHDDGTLEKKQFIAGGENTKYFWVFDGLSVGTKIVIKD